MVCRVSRGIWVAGSLRRVEGETEKFCYPPINRFSLNTLGETNSEKAIDMG